MHSEAWPALDKSMHQLLKTVVDGVPPDQIAAQAVGLKARVTAIASDCASVALSLDSFVGAFLPKAKWESCQERLRKTEFRMT